jgi:hypothetical protein
VSLLLREHSTTPKSSWWLLDDHWIGSQNRKKDYFLRIPDSRRFRDFWLIVASGKSEGV